MALFSSTLACMFGKTPASSMLILGLEGDWNTTSSKCLSSSALVPALVCA